MLVPIEGEKGPDLSCALPPQGSCLTHHGEGGGEQGGRVEQHAQSAALEPAPVARHDPNIVDWDGPDDPANPLNWSLSRKTVAIAIVSAITFVR